jgi:FAD/FMN-containing dehydrogenase
VALVGRRAIAGGRRGEPVLSGWGRTFAPGRELRSEELARVTAGAVLSRGLGRSYGDASLPPRGVRQVVGTTLADRVLAFDPDSGVLRAEAGLCLAELNRLWLPRGYFIPVTPGTKFVTLGGMVAADVHGKNHHRDGTIGRHVRALVLRLGDGRVVECSAEIESELFFATLGGMGLTGHILDVELGLQRIPSPWIYQVSRRIPDLDALLRALEGAARRWPFTVGWIDTLARGRHLGRGILYCGRWAEASEAPGHAPRRRIGLRVPFELPSFVLNRFTIAAFNRLLWQRQRLRKIAVVDSDLFFYPLDRIQRWNLLYGRLGVAQHQCVLPKDAAAGAIRAMFETLRRLSASSFLSVVKDCGPEGRGCLSFPRPGISLALDLPIRANTQEVIDRLNEHVIACGGRNYLAKDVFRSPAHLRAMDPRLDAFHELCRRWDPERTLRSAQSERIFGARGA